MPSENALCRKLGVSRETIRVAIDQLVAEGLVYKLKGSGTYFHREKVMTRDLNTDDALYKIGLVLQGQDTSANSGLIEGVRSVLTQEQVDLHVFLTDNKFCNERRCLETVVHQNFHGFIVDGVKSSILSPNLDCYKELYRRKIPVIFYNNFYRNLRCPRVTINDIECAHQLIGRLMDAGHSHIAGIFVYDNYQSVEKFQGMAEAMRNRGLELNDDYIKWCISDEAHNESYVRSIERFLKSIPKCTAIVTTASVGFIINMFVMGIWHGLAIQYLVYGLYHGVLLALTEIYQKKSKFYKKNKKKRWYKIVSWAITMNFVMFGFLIFSGHII